MLTINIGSEEGYDEAKNEFIRTGGVWVNLEHSLVSLSKWEAKYQVPFLAKKEYTRQELLDYVLFMVVTPNFDATALLGMTDKEWDQIDEYINSNQSATKFGKMPTRHAETETITSELIYYWMTAFNIPSQYENWHLQRLFALIRICNMKQQPPKKRSSQEIAAEYREINERRLNESQKPG